MGLYGGISYGFATLQLARENLRANQIMVEKLETIRLYTWEQISSNGFIPASFQEKFFPADVHANGDGDGDGGGDGQAVQDSLVYQGTISITDANFQEGYSTNLKIVRVSVVWTNANVAREREIETLVSKYGVQNQINAVAQN